MSSAPVQPHQRIQYLDVLRGFALAGVLFIFCVSDVGSAPGYSFSFADKVIDWFKYLLIENRMYTMLIMIFGIGFYVQLEKAKRDGSSLIPVFTRRLTGLLILGFIHAILLSTRDILMFYAIAGVVLLFVRNATTKFLFAIVLILFLVAVPVIEMLFQNPYPKAAGLVEPNNYPSYLQYNWQFFKLYHQVYPIYIDMIIHFLLGFCIGRARILQKIKTDKKFRKNLVIISIAGMAILIPFYYYWILEVFLGIVIKMKNSWEKFPAVMGIRLIGELLMVVCAMTYATLLISFSNSARGKRLLSPLAAFGQMALSNYLIQSLILVPYLLLGDKFNNLPPFNGFILFLVLFALQILFSAWWISHYTLGPFEWLLRSFTYWKWQSIKRSVAAEKNHVAIDRTITTSGHELKYS